MINLTKILSILTLATLTVALVLAVGCGAKSSQSQGVANWVGTWLGTGAAADITIIISGGPATYQISASSRTCTTTGTISVSSQNPNNTVRTNLGTICGGVNEGSGGAEQWVLAGNTLTIEYASGSPSEVYTPLNRSQNFRN
jgi:hypothetical protein